MLYLEVYMRKLYLQTNPTEQALCFEVFSQQEAAATTISVRL